MGGRSTSRDQYNLHWAVWLFMILYVAWMIVVWWFVFLGVVGTNNNDGVSDPTAIKWYYLSLAAASALILIIIFIYDILTVKYMGFIKGPLTWFFLQATYFWILWTIWAFIWDSMFSGLFPGGSPVIPAVYNGDQVAAFIYWGALSILVVSYITVLIVVWLIAAVIAIMSSGRMKREPEMEPSGKKATRNVVNRKSSSQNGRPPWN